METSQGVTFRWSWRTIRLMSLRVGLAVGTAIAVLVLWDAFTGDGPSTKGRPYDALMGLGLAAVAACACAVLIALVLMIGRACSKTVVTSDGLYVQRAPWHKNFVQWSDIQSAQRRDANGWRYIYMKTSSTLLDVGLSIEVDSLRDLAAEIARYAPQNNALRVELSKHVSGP